MAGLAAIAETPVSVGDLHRSLIAALEAQADPAWAKATGRFHKYEGFQCYGIRTSAWKALWSRFGSRFRRLSLDQRLSLANALLASGFEEQAWVAIRLWALSVDEMQATHFSHLDRGLDHFHSWSTTDGFCIDVLQPLLHQYPQEILTLLRKWNRSENRWKRRASVVAFARKVGASGQFVNDTLELCDNLIWDKEDLVQKGVGWALKDSMRGAKPKVLEYVKNLRRKGVPATITLYAIRDLRGAEREAILVIHRERV